MHKDADHPWFRPLWVRAIVVAICVGIALWDLSAGNYGWAMVFGGMAGYAVYIFFIKWDGDETAQAEPDGAASEDGIEDDEPADHGEGDEIDPDDGFEDDHDAGDRRG
ncbi:hypothetical protein [Pelagibacterium montanilacus]|uniref:hypothetical protein n=1 Tax=Pelagibacterium montanilacus TaxID=2185280 RepID=UPI000F8D0D66|nr:hypothetical protein [Pelagibacterium montanilacus]